MSIYQKVKLLFRASAEAPMRQLVANNDIVIFEQEIADAERSIKSAKLHLTQIKTEAKLCSASINSLKEEISNREQQVLALLDKDKELAKDLAGLIAEDETLLATQNTQLKHLTHLDLTISADIKSAVRAIQSHRQKLGFLKANQHSLHANTSIKSYANGMHSSIRDLNGSLQEINARQLRSRLSDEAEQDIEDELNNASIDERLNAAGIATKGNDAEQVIQRLTQQKEGN